MRPDVTRSIPRRVRPDAMDPDKGSQCSTGPGPQHDCSGTIECRDQQRWRGCVHRSAGRVHRWYIARRISRQADAEKELSGSSDGPARGLPTPASPVRRSRGSRGRQGRTVVGVEVLAALVGRQVTSDPLPRDPCELVEVERPDPHDSFGSVRRQLGAVRTEGERRDDRRVTAQDELLLAAERIPKADCAVAAGRRDECSVRAERDVVDIA